MSSTTTESRHVSTKASSLHTSYEMKVSRPRPSAPILPYNIQPTMASGMTRELPMPTVTRITSLGQAQATLQHCATKLSRPSSPIDANNRLHFQQWLEQWEHAFTAYLSTEMSKMNVEDVTRCRIIKANHLASTILASECATDQKSYHAFDADFAAIVELAAAVLQSQPSSNSSSSSQSPTPIDSDWTSVLGVRDPLYVVVARCDRASVRNKAVQLLQRTG